MSTPLGKCYRGTVNVHLRGFGFVDFADADAPVESAFVAPPDLNALLAGDVVEARLEESGPGRCRAVDVVLVERPREEVVGTVEQGPGKGRLALRLDPRIGNTDWPLEGAPKELRPGEAVVGEPDPRRARVRFLRKTAAEDAGRTATLVVHRIRTAYPRAVREEARRARISHKGRRDLRGTPTVTIDAPASRDLDDALAVLPVQPDGAIRVLVSIADIDTAVPAGSQLDKEARRRGTSVYLPDLVVPMLPRELSEDALSLLEGADRPALTVELRIDVDGDVTATDLSMSVIRSTARLSYDAVTAFLDRGEETVPAAVAETLLWLRTAAARLSAARAVRGGVTIERDEVALAIDRAGEPTAVDVREPTSAHLLIERLMVAANEAVARWLIDRGLPALFRVLDEPEPEQVERLAEFAGNFGFKTAFGGRLSARGLASFEEQFKTTTVAPSIRTVMHWLLGRARYQTRLSPHFALAAPAYLHFTSPIRRYADLIVHRVVKAHLLGERDTHLGAPELDRIADEVNDAARRARKAETDRMRQMVARLFAGRIGEVHSAHVVAAKPFGLVVQLDGLGVTGTVGVEALGPGKWELEAATYSLVSRERNDERRFMVGEAVRVRVASVDEELGRLDLELL